MGKKGSNPNPPDISCKPSPPPPPPKRIYKDIPFVGLVETKESKTESRDYEIYMKGWRDGFNAIKKC